MTDVCLFAHFDVQGTVDDYVKRYLRILKELSFSTVLISTSPLGAAEQREIAPFCADIMLRPNAGLDFAARLFAGLIVFSAVAEVATRATRLIQDNANLVKRVVFPLELLCVALVMQVAVHTALQMLVLGAWLLATGSGAQWSWLLLLPAWGWMLALQLALALALAALGCYLRDLQHIVPLITSGLLFLSPVFYASRAAPEPLRVLLALNPLSAPIELARAAWFGDAYTWADAVVPLAAVLLLLLAARWMFARLRPGFADLV